MSKYASKGVVLTLDSTTITQWRDGTSAGGDTERIDVTTHDTSGRGREYLAGFTGEDTYDFEILWDPNDASHQKLFDLKAAGTLVAGSLAYPMVGAGIADTFNAIVVRCSLPTAGVDSALVSQVSLSLQDLVPAAEAES